MFNNMTAWFSSSVDDGVKQSWRNNGGNEADFDTAQFIFSSDNSCPDTERVFNSSAYKSDHLAVFHSHFIVDRVKASNGSDVVLGKYFLPPREIELMVKKQMSFCWDTPADAQGNRRGTNLQPSTSRSHVTEAPPTRQLQPSKAPPTRQSQARPPPACHSQANVPPTRQSQQAEAPHANRQPEQVQAPPTRQPQPSKAPPTRQSQARPPPACHSQANVPPTRQSQQAEAPHANRQPEQVQAPPTGQPQTEAPLTRQQNVPEAPPSRHGQTEAPPTTQHTHTAPQQQAAMASAPHDPEPDESSLRLPNLRSSSRHRPGSPRAAGTQPQRSGSSKSMEAPPKRPDPHSAEMRRSHVSQATAVFHISQLKKVRTSELTEFLPGQHGAVLLRKDVGVPK